MSKPAEPACRFTCPIGPSVNKLFPTGGLTSGNQKQRRVKSEAYRRWLRDAGWTVHLQKPAPVAGIVRVLIEAPLDRRRDVDNALKPTLDLLVRLGIIEDDNRIDDLRIVRIAGEGDMVISIWSME